MSDRQEPDFAALYDAHPDYAARREAGSLAQAQIDIEVRQFKLPWLLQQLPPGEPLGDVIEIGCATGELIGSLPADGGRRIGVDISPHNVQAARERFARVEFVAGDFRTLGLPPVRTVILSDVREHVPDDTDFLRAAARLGDQVLVNLPLEDNWLNRQRRYGPDDVSGHLRCYSLADGLALFAQSGLEPVAYRQVWIHETDAEAARRRLRRERLGSAWSGSPPARLAKQAVHGLAVAWPAFGRRLYASNLFAALRRRQRP